MTSSPYKPGFQPPRNTTTVGLWLFLASLFVLFAAAMLAYVLIRVTGKAGAVSERLALPYSLWISSLLMLVTSVGIHKALSEIRLEHQSQFRLWIRIALGSAIVFVLVQVPALWQLIAEHQAVRVRGLHVYGLIFFLILLHALHVVGGLGWLVRVVVQGSAGKFDHEHYLPVRHAAMYWHFIDGVWFVMFAIFLLVG